MSPEIEEAIRLIDQKINDLQKAKQTLIETFGPRFVRRIPPDSPQYTSMFPTSTQEEKMAEGRKGQIANLIKEHGPLSSREIMERTKLSRGTVSYVLNDKAMFRLEEGKWYLIETEDQLEKEVDQGEEQK